MALFGKLVYLFDLEMTTPEPYGIFHIEWLILSIAVGILLCVTHREKGEARVWRVVAGTAILVFLLEVYKQISFTFNYTDGVLTGDFQWYAFPWQFCSIPMYVGLLTLIFRRGRVHKSLCAFLATYAMFAGLSVMLYPNTVFIETVGINLQTMICHGSMISVGIYLWYTGYVKTEHKTLLRALPVFITAVGVAALLNHLAFVSGLLASETFNMFFINPHCEPSLPVYSIVQEIVPFPWCVLIYIAGFSAAAYVVLLTVKLIKFICRKRETVRF